MQTLNSYNYTGRKAHIGKICFDDRGHMQVFVNYCSSCQGKVLMEVGEANAFSNKYATERNKLKNRFLGYQIKKRTF